MEKMILTTNNANVDGIHQYINYMTKFNDTLLALYDAIDDSVYRRINEAHDDLSYNDYVSKFMGDLTKSYWEIEKAIEALNTYIVEVQMDFPKIEMDVIHIMNWRIKMAFGNFVEFKTKAK
jgi:hypothetical protein